jgi:hypothetical protein
MYALMTKRAHLEAELSEAKRLDSEEYARLESNIEDIKQVAAEASAGFDEGDSLDIIRRLGDNARGDWSDG